MVFFALLLLALLALANGANDVSKGIATLAGSGVTETDKAIRWGTFWTILGSLTGLFFGAKLIGTFSNGIYVNHLSLTSQMALAISIAPALWVLLATRFGWPVSTTHAITGAFLGAGLLAFGWSGIAWGNTFKKIVLPLMASPILSVGLAYLLSPLLKRCLAKVEGHCLCLTPRPRIVPLSELGVATASLADVVPAIGTTEACETAISRFSLKSDQLHWLTSGLVSFARGLNDTPKIIAVVLPLIFLSFSQTEGPLFVLAALSMGVGSWLGGRRVTETLGFQVTKMNHQEGFTANLITAALVTLASPLGLPVSTTHISASAITGVGLAGKNQVDSKTVREMLLAWVVTVPASAALGMALLTLLKEIS